MGNLNATVITVDGEHARPYFTGMTPDGLLQKGLRDVSIDEVRTLVAERQRYDDWLAALEAKRSETPARVFERVHGDYFARRTGVIEKLREHVDALSSLGDDLEGRIGELESQLTTHEDERAEAMLRTAVGEYDGDRWETVRQDVEASIAQLAEKRTALLGEVEDVRTLLASARNAPPPTLVDAESEAEPAVDAAPVEPASAHAPQAPVVHETPVSVDPVELAATEAVYVDDAHDSAADELFAEHASRTPTPADAVPVQEAAKSVSPAPEDLDGTDFDDALALFSPSARSAESHPTPLHGRTVDMLDAFEPAERAPEAQVSAAAIAATADNSRAIMPQTVDAEAPTESARDPFDDLAFLRSVIDPATQNSPTRAGAAGDQQKTLRCTECGTMNFPTEWYCERCGGELAAF